MDLQTKKIFTANEASEYTGYAKTYILKLCEDGVIPSSNPNGKKVFIEREKLEAWMMSSPKKLRIDLEMDLSVKVSLNSLPEKSEVHPIDASVINEAMYKTMQENAKANN